MIQQHLDGSETPIDDFQRVRPGTWLYDEETEKWHLRSDLIEAGEDPGDYLTHEELLKENERTWGNGDFGPDDIAGHYFEVEIHRSVEYRFRIPAYEKYRAKEIADELSWDATPSDEFTVHSNTREIKDIKYRELPEDYDPYGGEPLMDALDRRQKEDGDE